MFIPTIGNVTIVRSPDEIAAQHAEIMQKIEAYEGGDPAVVGYLIGAAYTLKWALLQEDGSEFEPGVPNSQSELTTPQ